MVKQQIPNYPCPQAALRSSLLGGLLHAGNHPNIIKQFILSCFDKFQPSPSGLPWEGLVCVLPNVCGTQGFVMLLINSFTLNGLGKEKY